MPTGGITIVLGTHMWSVMKLGLKVFEAMRHGKQHSEDKCGINFRGSGSTVFGGVNWVLMIVKTKLS